MTACLRERERRVLEHAAPGFCFFVIAEVSGSQRELPDLLNTSVLVGVIEDFRFREPARRSTYAMPRRGAAVHVAAGIADIAALAAMRLGGGPNRGVRRLSAAQSPSIPGPHVVAGGHRIPFGLESVAVGLAVHRVG